MRKFIFMILAVFMLFSCDWAPTEVKVESYNTYKRLNLAVGDTVLFQIEGDSFSAITGSDSSIVKIDEADSTDFSKTFIIVGVNPGVSNISFKYNLPVAPDSPPARGVYYINLNVTDAFPLFINLGEWTVLDYGLYLSDDEFVALDSISVLLNPHGTESIIEYQYEPGTPDDFSIRGASPGLSGMAVMCYDTSASLITVLLFQVEISIKKQVLIELFTNSGCVNCPEANHYIDNIYRDHYNDVSLIRYHVSWTDPNDPMNLYNPTEVRDRVLYYNVFAAPGFVLDGSLISTLDEADWVTRIDAASRTETSIYISPIDIVESTDSLYLSFDLNSYNEDAGNLNIWTLVTEDSIEFLGTNGEDIHMQVMRDMTSTTLSGILNDESVSHSLKKPQDYGQGHPFTALVLVQDKSNKMILQSRKQVIF